MAVNAIGAVNAARAAASAGARAVFVSTDYVFDGEKGSATPRATHLTGQPVRRVKAAGERGVRLVCPIRW
jgi:dTDP-4-dehydrorhamnose reductase